MFLPTPGTNVLYFLISYLSSIISYLSSIIYHLSSIIYHLLSIIWLLWYKNSNYSWEVKKYTCIFETESVTLLLELL